MPRPKQQIDSQSLFAIGGPMEEWISVCRWKTTVVGSTGMTGSWAKAIHWEVMQTTRGIFAVRVVATFESELHRDAHSFQWVVRARRHARLSGSAHTANFLKP
jgi:hypothetical protein